VRSWFCVSEEPYLSLFTHASRVSSPSPIKLQKINTGGPTLEVAMAEAGLGLFHYMTPITGLMMTGER